MVSLLPISLSFDASCHCVKQLCPEARIAMDTCFNGDSSLAQLQVPSCKHSCSPHPTARWSSGTEQSICLWGRSQVPALLHPIARARVQPSSPVCVSGARDPPMPLTPVAILQHPPVKGHAHEIPNSKALVGIQQLLSIIIIFYHQPLPLLSKDPCHQPPHSPRGMDSAATVPFHTGHPETWHLLVRVMGRSEV